MSTDLLKRQLSDIVYWVEDARKEVLYHPKEGENYRYDLENIHLGEFHVIKTKDDLVNGMQAMAVAPIIKKFNISLCNLSH